MPSATESVVRAERKVRFGRVVSNKMQKTIVVQVIRQVRHPKYGRIIDQVSKFKAHDEENTAGIGDWVKIAETRPISRDKRWRLVEIVTKASDAPALPDGEKLKEKSESQSKKAKRAS